MVQPIVQQWTEISGMEATSNRGKTKTESVHLLNKVPSMCATATAEVTSTEDTQTGRTILTLCEEKQSNYPIPETLLSRTLHLPLSPLHTA